MSRFALSIIFNLDILATEKNKLINNPLYLTFGEKAKNILFHKKCTFLQTKSLNNTEKQQETSKKARNRLW
jgi:hypothetical protein